MPFFEAIFNTKVHYPRCIITLTPNTASNIYSKKNN